MKSGRIVAHKNTQVFSQIVHKLPKPSFTNERLPNSLEHKDCSVAVTDMALTTQRIGKDIRASS